MYISYLRKLPEQFGQKFAVVNPSQFLSELDVYPGLGASNLIIAK